MDYVPNVSVRKLDKSMTVLSVYVLVQSPSDEIGDHLRMVFIFVMDPKGSIVLADKISDPVIF